MKTISTKQNRCLNFEKGIACILVVCLHCEFPTYIGSVLNMVARIAVPLFFMISGYFFYSSDREKIEKRLPNKIKKTASLVAIYFIINFCYELIFNCFIFKTQTLWGLLTGIVGNGNLLDAILWNRTVIGIGGWFLPALLFCYILMFFINKWNIYKWAYMSIIPLFIGYFIISRFTDLPVWYSRNYLFDGMPFFLTGNLLACKIEYIRKVSNRTLILAASGGLIIACAERFTGGYDLYVGIILATITTFIFAINNGDATLGGPIEYVGTHLYLHCYLLHPFAIYIISWIGNQCSINNMTWFMWLKPIFVILLTLAASFGTYKLLNVFKKEKDK